MTPYFIRQHLTFATQRSTTLQNVVSYVIIPTYLNYVKGGYSDPDGRLVNDKGGSREVEVVGRGCEAIAEKQATSRLYCSRLMARQAGGLERVPRATIQLTRREVNTLTSVSSTETTINECQAARWLSCADATLSQLSHANLLSARCYGLACLL